MIATTTRTRMLRSSKGPATTVRAAAQLLSPPAPARVLVVSANPVVEAGVLLLLADHAKLDVCVGQGLPDPLDDMDRALYDASGLSYGTRDLTQMVRHPDPLVLALTTHDRPDLARRAMRCGADGAIVMDWAEAPLLAGVLAAAAGDLFRPTRRGGPVVTGDGLTGDDLTTRQRMVLQLICSGASNEQIAAELGVSINSLKSHIRIAYRRIGVQRRGEAVAWCFQHGLAS